jgi:hypothetical protein
MTSLLNSSYTQINDLISITADDITTENISTNTLIINKVPFNPADFTSNGNSTAITELQTILTGASWDSVYNFLNLTYNLHVYGTLFLGDPQIDVNYILSNLSSTYATIASLSDYETISDLQTNYVTYTAMIAEFNAQLANYVLYSGLTTTLNNYVSNSSLTTTLNNYVLNSSLTTKLSDYVLTTSLTTKLNDYVLNTSLTTKLNDYVLTTSLTTKLNDYTTTAVLTSDWVSKTYLTNQLSSYATTSSLSNYVTNSNLNNTLNNYCTKSSYDSLKNQADASTAWITANGVAVLGLIGTTAGLTASVATIQGQITAIDATLNDHETRITTVQNKTTNISYSVATNITTIGGSQLTTNAINASSFTTAGNISTTGGTITAFGDISSSGTIKGGTINTNNINTFTGTTLNIGNSATTINMGSTTLGNTIDIGNLLSTINLHGDVNFTSNNPFNMVNSYFYQF